MKTLHFILLLLPFSLFAQWNQLGSNINGDNPEDSFGRSVSFNNDGTRMAIGAYFNDTNAEDAGQVKVFDYINDNWVQVGQEILGENIEDYTGAKVALNNDGTILAVGSMGYGSSLTGRVSIYQEENGVWNLLGNHIEGASNSVFGQQLEFNNDGSRVIIAGASATGNGSVNNGLVQVYEFNGTDWSQLGQDIWGEALADFLGTYVAINGAGDRIAMSAPMHSGVSADNVGRVYMYELVGNSWIPLGQILEGTIEAQELGRGIAMNDVGDLVVAGSPYYLQTSRKVQVYKFVNNTWAAYGQELSGGNEDNYFGALLDFNGAGNILAVSVPFDSSSGFIRGAVKIYQDQNENWVQVGDDIYGEADEDRAGISIDLTQQGDKIAIASPFHDGPGGSDSGHVRVFSNDDLLASEEYTPEHSFHLFPNPTASDCTVKVGKVYGSIAIKMYDVIGNIVYDAQFNNTDGFNIKLDNLNSGVYFVSVLAEDSYFHSKLIKK